MDQKKGFYISKSNRRATVLLIALIIVIVFLPRVSSYLDPTPPFVITSEVVQHVDRIQQLKKESKRKLYSQKRKKKVRFKVPPRRFDPNLYTKNDWMALGLSEKQATVVMKFSSRGLKSADDLQRIFVIPDQLFLLVKDSLIFTESKGIQTQNKDESTKLKKAILIEVNSSTKEQLMSLPGIGEYISDRIINYRERLGGFARKEQLMEIKKIDIELYNKIASQITVDPSLLDKIKLNSASAEDIKGHPYLNWNIANSIIKMRGQKGGSFDSIDEIKESVLIDHELFEKLKPYLSL
jgi:competence protein ComEA